MSQWVAVDWGTSNLRLWIMGAEGEVLAERSSPKGMGQLTAAEYEPVLLDLLGDDLTDRTEVLICGMAGAKTGWCEAPYAMAPCQPAAEFVTVPTQDARLSVRILSGVCQTAPADVMRGEETQIAGFLLGTPDFDGVLCLPGTHTKWVRLARGQILSFRTVMTGELFDLLSTKSILRNSVSDGWDAAAFDQAVAQASSLADLFSIRAASLLSETSADALTARLSGMIIGQEIDALAQMWSDQPVVIIGADKLASLYLRGLSQKGADAQVRDGAELVRAGLLAAYDRMKELK